MSKKSVFTPEQLVVIRNGCAAGLSKILIARLLGISVRTLHRQRKTDAALDHEMAIGEAKAQASVGQALFKEAIGGNIKAITWWEMTRAGRSSRASTSTFEISDEQLLALSPAQQARILAGEDPALVIATP